MVSKWVIGWLMREFWLMWNGVKVNRGKVRRCWCEIWVNEVLSNGERLKDLGWCVGL